MSDNQIQLPAGTDWEMESLFNSMKLFADKAGNIACEQLAEAFPLDSEEQKRLAEKLFTYQPDEVEEVARYVLDKDTNDVEVGGMMAILTKIHSRMEEISYKHAPFLDPFRSLAIMEAASTIRVAMDQDDFDPT